MGPIARNSGHVHIREHEGGWQIFVPQDRDARDICYMRVLPHALASLFKIDASAAESIGHVLNSRLSLIDELLAIDGVGNVPGLDAPPQRSNVDRLEEGREEFEADWQRSETSVQTNFEAAGPSSRVTGRLPMHPERLRTPSSSSSLQESGGVSPSRTRSPIQIFSPAVPEEIDFTRDAYRELLDNVIRIARQAVFPHSRTPVTETGQFHPDYVHDDAFGVRTQGQMNHDFKVGAAGELFVSTPNSLEYCSLADIDLSQVYELLKRLFSPSFDWSNWTSTLNSYVLIHPEYRGQEPWPGRRETSDLRYRDRDSLLTAHLIEAGYLDRNVWSQATPEYFIEVKTTTGDCGDRLFMSNNQYNMVSLSFGSSSFTLLLTEHRCKKWLCRMEKPLIGFMSFSGSTIWEETV